MNTTAAPARDEHQSQERLSEELIELVDNALNTSRIRHRRRTGEDLVFSIDMLHQALEAEMSKLGELLDPPWRESVLKYLEASHIGTPASEQDAEAILDARNSAANPRIPEWVPVSKPAADWPFWYRYQRLLKESVGVPSTQEVDAATDRILNRIGNPRCAAGDGHPRDWQKRGLVVGHVQSGKTSNFLGLINKAADAGYEIIVVLSGIHEDLRVQTQERIDEGFIGSTSRGGTLTPLGERVGVGKIPVLSDVQPKAYSGTFCERDGDFSRQVAAVLQQPGHIKPLVLVVKKNASILRRVLKWLVGLTDAELPSGTDQDKYESRLHPVPHVYRADLPLLVVDDEADQASVDTKKGAILDEGDVNTDHDPTTINRLVRSILRVSNRSAYVGYTATPFANILIHEQSRADAYGEDLFPRDFIVSLKAPNLYVGPTTIFGCEAYDEDDDSGSIDGLPELLVNVDDHADDPADYKCKGGWLPPNHKIDHAFAEVSQSLKDAVADWTLAGAVLAARGSGHQHHSMLVHVTRFQKVMDRLHQQLSDYWDEWQVRVTNGDPAVAGLLKDRWDAYSLSAWHAVKRQVPWSIPAAPTEWKDLAEAHGDRPSALQTAVAGVVVKQVHGGAEGSALRYPKKGQVKVIAIGGNKLSRGFTLENLTVSYFLRTSRMYDTLMQMGRWFGYRPGYLDVCRLYMPNELRQWFEHMSTASTELRSEFGRMAARGSTPEEFGLRIRSHPVMTVTSSVKMRHGQLLTIGYSDDRPETISFLSDETPRMRNWDILRELVSKLGSSSAENDPDYTLSEEKRPQYRGVLWRGVSHRPVVDFLSALRTPDSGTRAHSPSIAEYIRRQTEHGELTEWSVFLRRNPAGAGFAKSEDLVAEGIKPIGRSGRSITTEDARQFNIKILIDSAYEAVDLSNAEYAEALRYAREAHARSGRKSAPPATPRGFARLVRPPKRGLLLLYTMHPLKKALDAPPDKPRSRPIELVPDIPCVGFSVSFPNSSLNTRVPYVVNNVFAQSIFLRMQELENEEDSD